MRIAIVTGGFILLFTLLIVALSLFTGGGGNKDSLLVVAQQQQETARVAGLITETSENPAVKNIAISTQVSLASDQQELTGLLGTQGMTFKEDELTLGNNPETDTELTTAQSAGLYDKSAIEILKVHLQTYQSAINNAYAANDNQDIQQALESDFQSAELLLKELESLTV